MQDPRSTISKTRGPCSTCSECEARVANSKRDSLFSTKYEIRVLTKQHETRVQHCISSRHKMPKNSHPQGFEASSSDAPSTDLRDYLISKSSIHQIAPQCHCEQLITAILSDCHCGFQTNKPSVFSRLSLALEAAKRRRSQKKKSFSHVEYLEVTAKMVGPRFTPSKSKGKQLAISSEESDDDWSPGLKDALAEPEGVYRHT